MELHYNGSGLIRSNINIKNVTRCIAEQQKVGKQGRDDSITQLRVRPSL